MLLLAGELPVEFKCANVFEPARPQDMKQHPVSLNFSTFGLTKLITECLPVSLTVCAPHLHNVSRHNLIQSNFTVGTD